MSTTRRDLLFRLGGVSALAILGLDRYLRAGEAPGGAAGVGELVADPAGLIDLAPGFRYLVLSQAGEPLEGGLPTPGAMDGMACFAVGTSWALVRNHELDPGATKIGPWGPDGAKLATVDPAKVYDLGSGKTPGQGGTTTLVYDPVRQVVTKRFLSLAGTYRNCAGGVTPWGSWITCEEDTTKPGTNDRGWIADKAHGYAFEVPATVEPALADPIPLTAMGRFRREAVVVDPATGVVYQTEDSGTGVFYRFVPTERGRLAAGGRLQALRLLGYAKPDTNNWQAHDVAVGQEFDVDWVDIANPDDATAKQAVAGGCQTFTRGEGMWWGEGSAWFACTDGGAQRKGQIWRYTPHPAEFMPGHEPVPRGRLTLAVEPDDATRLENCDNLTVSPHGGLIACEDNASRGATPENRLIHVAADGTCRTLARNALNDGEFAGACFSPDGQWLFVNIMFPGITLAITGPWAG